MFDKKTLGNMHWALKDRIEKDQQKIKELNETIALAQYQIPYAQERLDTSIKLMEMFKEFAKKK